ncbi:uncharacterized protein EV420DRAFT_1281252, partial [Desarmillaria tabescens]
DVDHRKGLAFLSKTGDIFYTPNAEYPIEVPLPHDPDKYAFHEGMVVDYYLYPQWWTEQFGWLAFIDRREHHHGYPFECLWKSTSIQSVSEEQSFIKDGIIDVADSWSWLEDRLIICTSILTSRYSAPCMRPQPPSQLYYKAFQKGAKSRLRSCVELARRWFSVWYGLFSFIIAYGTTGWNVRKVDFGQPDWFTFLQSRHFDFTWLEGILLSTIPPDPSYKHRVGTVLLPTIRGSSQPPVQWFIENGVPVWYPWTSAQIRDAEEWPHLFTPIAPPAYILQELQTHIHRPISPQASTQPGSQNVDECLETADLDPLHIGDHIDKEFAYNFPVPLSAPERDNSCPSLSQEPPGWIAFFDARDKRNAEREKTETEEHRAVRLSRERNPPTTWANGLYEWVEDSREPRGWRREDMGVKREYRAETLEDYSSKQKRYDSWCNEWDVCLAWGEDLDTGSDDEDSYTADPIDSGPSVEKPDLILRGFQRTPSPDIPMPEEVTSREAEQTSGFLRTLFCQFGFTAPTVDIAKLSSSSAAFKHVLQAFGLSTEVAQSFSSSTASAITQFLQDISKKHQPLADRWDASINREHGLAFHPLLFTLKVDQLHTTYIFPEDNYQAYIENRAKILYKPHGHAALLHGGIIWHLAKEHLSVDAALHGPSTKATEYHLGFVLGHKGEAWSLWDDDLGSDEADLICRLYRCKTGHGDQLALKSWWLLQHTWDLAGVNMGFWSEENERWYQSRLHKILEGKAKPMGVDQWRNELQGFPVTRNIRDGLRELSLLPSSAK